MKQLAITIAVSALVAASVSWVMRPVPDARQKTRLERVENRLRQVATVVGIFFGEDNE